jgi:hypothetical protein
MVAAAPGSDAMTPPETPAAGRADELRRSLDRAVRGTRVGRLLAACGCWLAAASCLVAALAAVDICSAGRLGLPAMPEAARAAVLLVAAGIPVIAFVRWRLLRDGWPDRLGIAIATEARHPALGETLSRAVGFVDEPRDAGRQGGAANPSPATVALQRLAIDQAADASRQVGGPVLPGLGVDLRAAAAGVATAVALWLSTTCLPGRWAAAVQRQFIVSADRAATPALLAPPSAARPAAADSAATTALPADVLRAAGRLALAAAVERLLGDLLAARFAQAPGVPAAALPRQRRQDLDELAAIQTDCSRSIAAARRTIVDSRLQPAAARHDDRLLAAIGRLDGPEVADADTAAAHITANRLQLAATAADRAAELVAEVAAELGAAPVGAARDRLDAERGAALGADLDGDPGTQLESDRPLARAVATIARIAADSDHSAAASARVPAGGSRPAAASGTSGSAAAGSAGTTTATTDPSGASSSAAAVSAETGATAEQSSPLGRVWSRLPATARSQTARTALESMPPVYRPAIDAYYRLLLQSMPDPVPDRPDASSR